MRKTLIAFMLVCIIVTFASFSQAYADCGGCKVSAKKGEIINDSCPVMGGKVDKDTPYKIEYKNKAIGFCCPGCIDKFKSDPEAYMAKIQKKCMIKCPKCGAEIDLMQECKKAKISGACLMPQK
ncbi:MAG: YHS domain-containing protein [Candidatus Omnitrophica bacterium]|nr:YHS domain-containing protein [Candidatus Omnitrophota bacterium]